VRDCYARLRAPLPPHSGSGIGSQSQAQAIGSQASHHSFSQPFQAAPSAAATTAAAPAALLSPLLGRPFASPHHGADPFVAALAGTPTSLPHHPPPPLPHRSLSLALHTSSDPFVATIAEVAALRADVAAAVFPLATQVRPYLRLN